MTHSYEVDYFAARVDTRRRQMQKMEAARIRDYMGYEPDTVLDVGCGTGEFAVQFPQAAWFGVEESFYATQISRMKGISFDLPDGDGWADLVVFRGSLQHLDQPVQALRDAHRVLRKRGWLAILATPNAGSLVYRIHQHLPCLVPELNYWVPSTKTLSQTLQNVGFDRPFVEYPYLDTPYARPWKDLAALLLGKVAPAPGNMLEAFVQR